MATAWGTSFGAIVAAARVLALTTLATAATVKKHRNRHLAWRRLKQVVEWRDGVLLLIWSSTREANMRKRVLILSKQSPYAYENLRLRGALEACGLQAECCDPSLFSVTMGTQTGFTYRSELVVPPDLVLVRTGSGTGSHSVTLLRAMMAMGVIVVNPISGIQAAMDKVATLQVAESAGLPIPKTMVFCGRSDVVSAWTGGFANIVKLATGSHGVGTFKCESPNQLKALVQMITALDPKRLFLVQEYLGDRPGIDLRVLVIGGRALDVAMMRSSGGTDFRSGISTGGTGTRFEMTPEIAEISERIVQRMQLDIAGVDLLWKGDKMVICEVNSAPGFYGFETYCYVRVAERIAAYVKSRLAADP
jgi:gamma-F420-2:alpha-L-glutamate ligase